MVMFTSGNQRVHECGMGFARLDFSFDDFLKWNNTMEFYRQFPQVRAFGATPWRPLNYCRDECSRYPPLQLNRGLYHLQLLKPILLRHLLQLLPSQLVRVTSYSSWNLILLNDAPQLCLVFSCIVLDVSLYHDFVGPLCFSEEGTDCQSWQGEVSKQCRGILSSILA